MDGSSKWRYAIIGLIIFDSLTRFHDANENDSREMSSQAEYFVKDFSVSSYWEFLETLDTIEDKMERDKGLVYESIAKQDGKVVLCGR